MSSKYAYPALYTSLEDDTASAPLRDDLLIGANGGVAWLFDLSFPYSYPGGPYSGRPDAGAPLAGAQVADIAGGAAGSVSVSAPGAIQYAGGGFDLSAAAGRNNCVRGPAGCLDGIYDDGQQFMVVGYYRLPAEADWYADSGVMPIFATNEHTGGYPSAVDMLTIAATSGGGLSARRQTNGGSTAATASLTITSGHFGKVAQIGCYRNAAGFQLQLRTSLGILLSSLQATGSNNSGDFSSLQPQWGITQSLWDFGGKPSLANFREQRVYRGWIENLVVSARDPLAVLDADWTRVMARGDFT
ncbi:hypothetical protein HHL08_15865 [Sphingobium sp. AR-3-1]|uniref:Uncharacterized protein n=1 Tax=Sphingobium psychrophilum TaxID=2728834 RepID=A0A7X9WXB2_9SPHN|nr:hypothetical protein [Sphingobium psychrophilum]NML11607.1 hypothetical protein [Sphingobium psychrophilum]